MLILDDSRPENLHLLCGEFKLGGSQTIVLEIPGTISKLRFMHPGQTTRRKFLIQTGAAASMVAASTFGKTTEDALGAEDSRPPTPSASDTRHVRILLREPDHSPISHDRRMTLHARDLANDPLPLSIISADGRVRIALTTEPLQVSMRLNVPGFGEVYCYADNGGKGFSEVENVEFVVDAAATRLRRVRDAAEQLKGAGITDDAVFQKHLAGAARPIPKESKPAQTAAAYAALADGLHAGERLTLLAAQHRIRKFSAPRKEFLFGCLGSGWQRGGDWEKRFLEAFNCATISWYTWKNEQPQWERIEYTRMDQSLQWALNNKISPKGFGYVYMAPGAIPEWFRTWDWKRALPEYQRIVEQTTKRYHGRIPCVEVINEAHDKANLFRFSQAQILELTRAACEAARRGSATVKRQINHCCMWAEYAKRPNSDGSRRWSPHRYLSDCLKNGVEFEVIGLQLYYPQHDLFEIERMLNRFTVFKRPIHITEMACNSADGLDPASMRPKSLVPGWHGPWTENLQADWLEAIYTICYSKPEIEAVGWWDLSDTGGHFWPHGGLLRPDMSPKESFGRLLELQKRWGVSKSV